MCRVKKSLEEKNSVLHFTSRIAEEVLSLSLAVPDINHCPCCQVNDALTFPRAPKERKAYTCHRLYDESSHGRYMGAEIS